MVICFAFETKGAKKRQSAKLFLGGEQTEIRDGCAVGSCWLLLFGVGNALTRGHVPLLGARQQTK